MHAIHTKARSSWLVVVATALCAWSAAAADEPKPALKGLSPEQIRAVQFVGRAVLAAKHSETEDPQHAQLRDRLQDLRKTLDELAAVAPGAGAPTLAAQPGRRGAGAALDDAHPLTQDLRARRRAMQAARAGVEQELARRTPEDRRTQFHSAAAKKVEEIELDLERALNAPVERRRARLLELRARLEDNPLKNVPSDDSPGLATIVRHRE
jgi:hypothetical protein